MPIVVIVLLYFFQLLFRNTYIDLRTGWLDLLCGIANYLLHTWNRWDGHIVSYSPDKFFLSIRYQIVSVGAVYLLGSTVLAWQLAYAGLWFMTIQLIQVLRLMFMSGNPTLVENVPDSANQLVFQVFLLIAPVVIPIIQKKAIIKELFSLSQKPLVRQHQMQIMRLMLGLALLRAGWVLLEELVAGFDGVFTTRTESFISPWGRWADSLLTDIILVITGSIVTLYGYHVQIIGIEITDGISSVGLGEPCIGKGILMVYIIVLLLSRGPVWRKLAFLGIGVVSLLLLNAIRLSLLFAFVEEFGAASYDYDQWHSIYSGFIYLCVICFWWSFYRFGR